MVDWKPLYWFSVWMATILSSLLDRFWSIRIPGPISVFLRIAGIAIIAYSVTLTSIAGRTLRKYGHIGSVERFGEPNHLVMKGIYSCMRHPIHLGLAFMPIGIALLLASQTALLFSGWGFAAAMFFLVRFEEPGNLVKFGVHYIEYMRKTPPFTLSIGCLIKGIRALKTSSHN